MIEYADTKSKKLPFLDSSMISLQDYLSTLPHYRTLREIESVSGIKYSTLSNWASDIKRGEDLPDYVYFFIEYFRRVDLEQERVLEERLKSEEPTSLEDIGRCVMNLEDFKAFRTSSVRWKRDLTEHFLSKKKVIMEKQSYVINAYIEVLYKNRPNSKARKDVVRKISMINPTEGL
jgi:hypothetical protein